MSAHLAEEKILGNIQKEYVKPLKEIRFVSLTVSVACRIKRQSHEIMEIWR